MATTAPRSRATERDLFPDARLAPTAALLGASIAVRDAFQRLANGPAGLDPETADLVVRIGKSADGSLRGVDIAQQLKVSATRVSRLVDRAEAAGLVERLPDPHDRRAQRLVLTDGGQQTARIFAPLVDDLLEAMVFAEFSERERATLIGLLDRLAARATRLVEAADSQPPRAPATIPA